MRRSTPLSYAEAKSRAGALCSRCEQCTPDLMKKFTSWGLSASQASKLIDELTKLRWVDDNRYARAYAHDKIVYSGWGRSKIVSALYARRLPREAIEQAFDEILPEEYNTTAARVIRSKIISLRGSLDDFETRAKILRFGVGRGFEPALVSRIINVIRKREADEDDE